MLTSSRRPRQTHRKRTGLVAALALILPFAALSSAQAADVGTNVSPDTANFGTGSGNVYFAYVEAGEYVYSSGTGGTANVFAPGSSERLYGGATTSAGFRTPRLVTPETAGVWTFQYGGAAAWNVTVFDGNPGAAPETTPTADEITGRVWVESYRITQPGGRGLKDLSFWMLNDSGYQYALNLTGYDGINSTLSADSLGIPQGTEGALACAPSYRSVNAGDNPIAGVTSPCASPYRLFFEEPADDLPVSAPIAPTTSNAQRTTQVIQPAPVDPADLDVSDFDYVPGGPGTAAGTISYDLGEFFGGHELQIDVDGDGDYTSDVDRVIRLGAGGEPLDYAFDGLDGEGNPISPCTDLTARVYFDRVGEVHVVQADVEGRAGIEVIRQNGPGAPDDVIYWDDSATSTSRVNTTPLIDGTAGQPSAGGAHGWAYNTNAWGNEKYIDDWTYVPADRATGEEAFRAGCSSSLAIDKSSELVTDRDDDGNGDVGDVLRYTFTVSNTSNVDARDVSVDDDRVDEVTPARQDVPAGQDRTFTADYTITQDDVDNGSIENVATASGTEPDGDRVETPPGRDIYLPSDRDPGLTIEKGSSLDDTDDDGVADIGETINYTFDVENTGNVTMADVSVDDDRVDDIAPGPVTLAPGERQRFTASYVVTAADILTGVVHNEATATGESPTGPYTSDPDEEDTDTADAEPGLDISKSSVISGDEDGDGNGDVGDVVTYTFRVTNTGNTALTGISVDDPLLADGAITPASVDLAIDESADFTATYTITQDDIDRGTLRNVATATGTFTDPEDPDNPRTITSPPGDTIVELEQQDPQLVTEKDFDLADENDNARADVGEEITYSFIVRNTGNTTLENVTVFDAMVTGITPGSATLAPGEEQEFTSAPYTVTQADVDAGGVTNVASSRGNIPGGRDTTSDPDEVIVEGPDADPSLELVKESQLLDENGNGTADEGEQIVYSFTVTNTGNVTMRDIVVTDPMLAGLLPDPIAILAPGEELVVTAQPYTVTEDDVTGDDIVNVASVGGESPDGDRVVSEDASTTTPSSELPPGSDGGSGSGSGSGGGDGVSGVLPDAGSPMWWGTLLAALAAIGTGIALLRGRRTGNIA